jgi:periplasmic protein TonB
MHAAVPAIAAHRHAIHGRAAERKSKLVGIGAAIALHAIVVYALLQFEPVRSALTVDAPIVVRLVSPPSAVEKRVEPPKPLPVKPRVRRPKPVVQPPIMTAITEAPTPFVAPAPPPRPLPPVEAPTAASAAAVSAPSAPVIPPSFNADYLNNPPPVYPALSRRMGEEGKVVLRVFVNEEGLPAKVELRTPSGFSRLDSVALETVRQWKFVPARRGDQAVAAWVLVPISFSLRS